LSQGRRWFSIAETAAYFGLKSPKTLYSLGARGRLPEGSVLRLGRQVRLNIALIEAQGTLSTGRLKGRSR